MFWFTQEIIKELNQKINQDNLQSMVPHSSGFLILNSHQKFLKRIFFNFIYELFITVLFYYIYIKEKNKVNCNY